MSVADFDLYGGRVTFVIKACAVVDLFKIFADTSSRTEFKSTSEYSRD